MTKQQELIKELESLAGKMRTPKHRRRSEQILIELKQLLKGAHSPFFIYQHLHKSKGFICILVR